VAQFVPLNTIELMVPLMFGAQLVT